MYIQKVLHIEWKDIPDDEKADYFIGQILEADDYELIKLAKNQGYDSLDLDDIDYIEIEPS